MVCPLSITDFLYMLNECCDHESHILQDLLVSVESLPSCPCHYSNLLTMNCLVLKWLICILKIENLLFSTCTRIPSSLENVIAI